MGRLSHFFAIALLAFIAIGARQAKADYVYTFTSSFGTIQISNPELLANGSFNVPVTFLQGSGSLDFIEANQFDFVNGQTSTGIDFDQYAFVFFPFPDSPGDYSTVGNGFVSFTPPGGDLVTTDGTLSIASVPELSTWAMAGLAFIGLGVLGRRGRRSRAIRPA